MDAAALDDAATFDPNQRTEHFQFTGSGAEYFRIWIVNLLLTIVTLGVYSAWAKVRKLRYFYGNTRLAGSTFEYHGEPKQILKGRLIAAAFLIPYFAVAFLFPPWDLAFWPLFLIALPWLVVKSRQFSLRMTSWRNIRFDFAGNYGSAAGVYIGLLLLSIVTLGLAAPYWTYARQRYLVQQTRFGTSEFDFRARPGAYYAAILLGGLIIGAIILVLTLGVSPLMDNVPKIQVAGFDLRALVVLPGIGLAYMLGFAFMNARMRNAGLGNTYVGPHKLECRLKVWPLFGLYVTNALAALVSLGLLIPWAQVRLAKYQLANMSLSVAGNLDAFVSEQRAEVAAAGEELGDLLDVDFGL